MEPMECVAVKMESDDDSQGDEHWKGNNNEFLQCEGSVKSEDEELSIDQKLYSNQGGCGLWDTYLFSDRQPYCCVKCGLLTATRRHLLEHFRHDHCGDEGGGRTDEPAYSYGYELPNDLIGHTDGSTSYSYRGYRIAKKQREKRFACDLCDYKAGQPSHLASHKRMHSGSKRFVCDLCGYRTHSASHLRRHKTVHSDEKPYACDLCDYRTAQPYNLKYHMRKHSEDKRFACGICDYKAMDSRCLEKHLKTHTGERPYACDLCDYRATQVCNLVKHKRTHSAEKPFTCETCDYKCSNAIALASHRLSHTPEGPLVCPQCPFTAERLKDLLRHKRLFHTERKLFACDLCQYTTYDSSNAKKHVLTHVAKSERPYACGTCDYRSSDPGALKKHSRKHTGERPFACDLCDYAANTLRQLHRHRLKHGDEKKYICDECGFVTNQRKELVTHLELGHEEDDESCILPPVEVTILDEQEEPENKVIDKLYAPRTDDRDTQTPWSQAWDNLVEHAIKRSGFVDQPRPHPDDFNPFKKDKTRWPLETEESVKVLDLSLNWGNYVESSLDDIKRHVLYKESPVNLSIIKK